MLFSHREQFVLKDSMSSGVNVGQLCGHSCFKICGHGSKRDVMSEDKLTNLDQCYHPDKRLNCLVVGVTHCGSAVCTMHASYTSRASVIGPVSGRWSSRSNLLGYLNLVSG